MLAINNKEYTVLENAQGDILIVNTDDIYDVVYLNTGYDRSYIYNTKTGDLTSTEDYYPSNYFRDSDEILVVMAADIASDEELSRNLACERHLTIYDGCDEIDVIDVTDTYMSYTCGHAVDIEHGINTDTIVIDVEDDIYGYKTVDEVNIVDWYCEYVQDYPNQEYTRILILDNGKRVRETSPFFPDDDICSYEYCD